MLRCVYLPAGDDAQRIWDAIATYVSEYTSLYWTVRGSLLCWKFLAALYYVNMFICVLPLTAMQIIVVVCFFRFLLCMRLQTCVYMQMHARMRTYVLAHLQCDAAVVADVAVQDWAKEITGPGLVQDFGDAGRAADPATLGSGGAAAAGSTPLISTLKCELCRAMSQLLEY